MNKLDNIKKTRLKAMFYTNLFLATVTFVAIHYSLESLASTCIGGVLTITTIFIAGDSYRKSEKQNAE